MKTNIIYNENCLETMKNHINKNCVDLILTSPPYNIADKSIAYDVYEDKKSFEDYSNFILECFKGFSQMLKKGGIVIWNWSYGNNNISEFFILLARIIQESDFEIIDRLIWKKKSAKPDNLTSYRLTRIVEDVFIFRRKGEEIKVNKQISSIRKTGQKMYSPIFNFIEAKNNDFSNELNKATFSSELVLKLLNVYCKNNYLIYDPFMGTGTTAVGVKMFGGGVNILGLKFLENKLNMLKKEY